METEVERVLLSNEATPPEYQVICEGYPMEYSLDQWVRIRDYKKITERIKGDCYATWTVLCERDFVEADEKVIHPFIVWTLVARPEGWHFELGHYCATYEEARKKYDQR